MDNFGCDPLGGHSMLATAENVAKRHGITTAEQHEVVLRREALNDMLFARATGIDWRGMNNWGCSLVWGHTQAPMGTRAIIELIEELALRGGGFGRFTGCAAGDTAMAVVLEVCDR